MQLKLKAPNMELMIDVMRTRQILINLIQNAFKASKNNQEVKVIVSKPKPIPDSSKVMLLIKVVDFGHGIDHKDRKNLFKPFF